MNQGSLPLGLAMVQNVDKINENFNQALWIGTVAEWIGNVLGSRGFLSMNLQHINAMRVFVSPDT
jgi:hypothetical protein